MGTPGSGQERPPPQSPTNPLSQKRPRSTKLSSASLSIIRHSLGCTIDPESSTLIHTTSIIYPPRGVPPGLYKSIILSRTISQYQYLFSTLIFNLSLILQVLLGAAVTALGSSDKPGVAVTVLAAANTVNAGLLALMHNSGLPERYKNDWSEFEEVEMWIRKVVETGVVEMTGAIADGVVDEWEAQEVVYECFERYVAAKRTVARNKPSVYIPAVAKRMCGGKGKAKDG